MSVPEAPSPSPPASSTGLVALITASCPRRNPPTGRPGLGKVAPVLRTDALPDACAGWGDVTIAPRQCERGSRLDAISSAAMPGHAVARRDRSPPVVRTRKHRFARRGARIPSAVPLLASDALPIPDTPASLRRARPQPPAGRDARTAVDCGPASGLRVIDPPPRRESVRARAPTSRSSPTDTSPCSRPRRSNRGRRPHNTARSGPPDRG